MLFKGAYPPHAFHRQQVEDSRHPGLVTVIIVGYVTYR
jgi:hypothetical protein